MKYLLKRFLLEQRGQDIIEYALLSAGISLVGIAAWQNIGDTLGDKYQGWDAGIQDRWEPDDPLPAGS